MINLPEDWVGVYKWCGISSDWVETYIGSADIWQTYNHILNKGGLLRFDYLVDILHSRKKARAIIEILSDMGLVIHRGGWVKLKPALSWHDFFNNKEEMMLHA